jgi:hypothetical protein
MLIYTHKQATTTPKVRAAFQASDEAASVLAEKFGTTGRTVLKWKHRDSVHDRSHTSHHLKTTLMPAQEAVAVVLDLHRFRSGLFESNTRHQGDRIWQRYIATSSSGMRFALRSPVV